MVQIRHGQVCGELVNSKGVIIKMIKNVLVVILAGFTLAGLSSCGVFGLGDDDEKSQKEEDPGQPITAENGGGLLAGLSDVNPQVNAHLLPAEDDIVWAEEDPNKPMALDEVWSKPTQSDWYVSYKKALNDSRKSGKPLLIWFTNSASSPTCKLLSNELFSTSQFKDWADENVILLRLDSNVQESDDHLRTQKREYIDGLKRRYKVLGAPVVQVLSPRGNSYGNYRGYRSGDPGFYFGRLKTAQVNAKNDYGRWRENLEKKGYRMWHDLRGRTLFAKLLRYSKGDVLLVEPDGTKSKTHESKLSSDDARWINEQKAKRRAESKGQ